MTFKGFQYITSWTLVQDQLLISHVMVMSEQVCIKKQYRIQNEVLSLSQIYCPNKYKIW